MKITACTALTTLLLIGSRCDADVSMEVVYERLQQYGDWLEVGTYGYCWQPRDVAADWRPYTVGEWAYTEAGWMWVSQESFGWATYHYGRWLRLDSRGWIWVPDTQWAPAWVSWRENNRFVGWAPLPPESRGLTNAGLGSWVDSRFDVGPAAYTFVELRHFGSAHIAEITLSQRETASIVAETRNVTDLKISNNIVVNYGPDYGAVSRAADRPIRKLRLERQNVDVNSERGDLRTRIEGETVRVIAPKLTAAPAAKPPRIVLHIPAPKVDRGWDDSESGRQTDALRAKFRETSPPATTQDPTLKRGLPEPRDGDATSRKRPSQARTQSRPPTPEPQPPRESKPDSLAQPSKANPRAPSAPGSPAARPEPGPPEVRQPDHDRVPARSPVPVRPRSADPGSA